MRWRTSYGEHGVVGFAGEGGERERERTGPGCTPSPLPQPLFVIGRLEYSLEGGGGLEGGDASHSPFTHKPTYTVLPI